MSRLPLDRISIFAFLILLGYIVADLGLLSLRGGMFPQQPPPAMPQNRGQFNLSGGNFNGIKDRNIFNSDGKIAAALGEAGGTDTKQQEVDPEPVPSTLPITLLGTIVHANPVRSIASIGLKSKNEQIAVKVGDVIPEELATVIWIERSKITFRNKATNRREFIELKDDSKINFGAAKPVQQGEVTVLNDNTREIKRGDIDRLTSNLPELLQQARAVPRMGPGGAIECFSLADISGGSIYERLGLKKGDCIKSVNGEQINSPAKAMELYNALRSNANTINLGIERGGRDDNFQYNILQ